MRRARRSGAENPPAILLGGEAIALAAARSLGATGVPVHVLGDATWDTVSRSRFCASFVDLGSGDSVQARWLRWLDEARLGGVVFPCADEGLELVARNRARLEALGYTTIEADDEVLLAMLDKERTYALAREIGVPAPRTVSVRDGGADAAELAAIEFPCAVKPLHSHVFARRFGLRQKVFVVNDRRELEQTLERMVGLGLEVLVTEIVPGADDGYSSYYGYLDGNGESLLHFTKRKLRQYPPGFGLGSYHVTAWDAETAELGLRFFQGVGVRGLANVEFKRDARDGRLKLIECNHRFTAATELVRLAGIDLPLFAYNRLLGRELPPVACFREGVRLWLPIEDVRALLGYRRDGELSFPQWMRSVLHRQHFQTFRLDDPLPALASYGRRFARLGSRLARPFTAASAEAERA